MEDHTMTSSGRTPLAMTWEPVRDARGRIHMEARWTSPAATPAPAAMPAPALSRTAAA